MNPSKSFVYFLILTFAVNWLMALGFYLSGLPYSGLYGMVFGMFYMLIPAAVSLLLQKYYNKESIWFLDIRFKPNAWFFIGGLIPPVLVLLSIVVSFLLPDVTYSPDSDFIMDRFRRTMSEEAIAATQESAKNLPVSPLVIGIVQGIIAGFTVNAVFAFGEELGWRGYMHRHLIHSGFWKTALFTGIIWGIWHAPMILMGHNYPEHPQSGVFMMTILTVLMSPFFTLVRLRSGSVIAPAIAHGTFNGTAGLSYMYLKGGSDLTNGITGVAGFIVFLALNIIIWLYVRRQEPENKGA